LNRKQKQVDLDENLPNPPSGGKQFRLVKYFAYASFFVILIFSFPFSVFLSQKAKNILLRSYENYALLLGENLNHQVVQNFMIPIVMSGKQISLRDEEQFQWIDRIVKNTIHSFNIETVNMYEIETGRIVYATNPRLFGRVVNLSIGYKRALEGESTSTLISGKRDLWGLGIGLPVGKWLLRTYIPMTGVNPLTGEKGVNPFTGGKGELIGILELLQDLSNEYQSIVKFQFLVFGLSVLIMGLIFIALLLIVRKAENTIEERARKQRALEDQLNQAARLAALGEMVAGVSHEIKNPLGIIQSTAQLLGEMPDASHTQKRLSAVIKEESIRLNGIVIEFLDFARPRTPKLQESRLEDIIHRNLVFLQPELEKQRIAVESNLNGRSFPIQVDEELLYRALLNIFLNAMQSMDQGGTIRVDIKDHNGQYHLEIGDSGRGIDPEKLRRIFDPFFTTREKGTGLGLSIVKKIIEGHGGTIAVDSKLGEGTVIKIRLPMRA
jgi:signal transduction histidine kinase